MPGYYDQKLAAENLRKVYEIAPPRVKQYLEAEINFVLKHITRGDIVLELGCGYGRALQNLVPKGAIVIGLDTSFASLRLIDRQRTPVVLADAARTSFRDGAFDVVVCIQNGISAFHVDPQKLVSEAVRVTRPGGTVLFSSYSDKFWDQRLHWFELQAQHGLLGEIDYDATGDGVIVCKDGFRATTVSPDQFITLTAGLGVGSTIEEIDGSSLFSIISLP